MRVRSNKVRVNLPLIEQRRRDEDARNLARIRQREVSQYAHNMRQHEQLKVAYSKLAADKVVEQYECEANPYQPKIGIARVKYDRQVVRRVVRSYGEVCSAIDTADCKSLEELQCLCESAGEEIGRWILDDVIKNIGGVAQRG